MSKHNAICDFHNDDSHVILNVQKLHDPVNVHYCQHVFTPFMPFISTHSDSIVTLVLLDRCEKDKAKIHNTNIRTLSDVASSREDWYCVTQTIICEWMYEAICMYTVNQVWTRVELFVLKMTEIGSNCVCIYSIIVGPLPHCLSVLLIEHYTLVGQCLSTYELIQNCTTREVPIFGYYLFASSRFKYEYLCIVK